MKCVAEIIAEFSDSPENKTAYRKKIYNVTLQAMPHDLIILSGAPGSGKTTIAKQLQKRLDHPPYIEFGTFRQFHLLPDWSNQSNTEEQLSFSNLICTLENYFQHGYENVIVTDLKDDKVQALIEEFSDKKVIVFTLTVEDEDEHAKRIRGESSVGPRDSGFTDVEDAFAQRNYLDRKQLPTEKFIDNTHTNPNKTVNKICEVLGKNS